MQNKRLREYRQNDIHVHPNSKIDDSTRIGKGTNINGPAYISSDADAPVTIGKYCAIAHNLRIRSRNHFLGYINLQGKFQKKFNLPSLDRIKGKIVIGNNVWIGDNVTILSGVKVGDGAVLGAGSVVTKDVLPYSIVAGVPVKLIKMRFSESIVTQLVKVSWWDWSDEKILLNKTFFSTDFSKKDDFILEDIIKEL